MQDRNKVFAKMSGNFLTEHLPDDWASWPDKKLKKFFSENAWHPFEHWNFEEVFDLIEHTTNDVMELLKPNPAQKWTHDFNFVFTVNTHQSDPDKISPEIIVDRFMDTVQNMSREEIFERSECYNSFVEELDNENDKESKQKKTDWIIVYSSDYEEWQVSDGPVGNRGSSYDFKTKEEAEQFLKELRQEDCNSKTGVKNENA